MSTKKWAIIDSGNGLLSAWHRAITVTNTDVLPIGPIGTKSVNTLRPGRNEQRFADDIFKLIFLNENVWTPIKMSLKFVPKGPINNIPALVQIMAWHRPGDKPLSEPMMVSLPTHICVTGPQWVKRKSKSHCTKFLSKNAPWNFARKC